MRMGAEAWFWCSLNLSYCFDPIVCFLYANTIMTAHYFSRFCRKRSTPVKQTSSLPFLGRLDTSLTGMRSTLIVKFILHSRLHNEVNT